MSMVALDALSTFGRAEARRLVALASVAPIHVLPLDGPPDATLEFPPGGGVQEHPLSVPALPEMDALEVTRAELVLSGVAIDAPWVSVSHGMSSSPAELARQESGEAQLTSVRIEGLSSSASLSLNGVMLQGSAVPETRAVRVLLTVLAGGDWSPPAAAAPAFGAPGGSSHYKSMLAGASLQADAASKTFVLSLDPPLRCSRVRVLLLKDADEVSPTTSTSVDWSATSVQARWRSVPTAVSLSLVEGQGAAEQQLGALPTLEGRFALELAGALHGMLSRQHAQDPFAAPSAKLRVQSSSAGKLELRTTFAAWYRRRLENAPPVALKGSPAYLRRVSAAGAVPRACAGTLHGQWGRARLVANADRDEPAARSGVSLTAARRFARWLPLTADEAERGLLRLSVYARALESAELLLAVYSGDASVVGRMIGKPVSTTAEPTSTADWLRGELQDLRLTGRTGVWVVAWLSRGALQCYARAGSCQISPDSGQTWSVASVQPLIQAHFDASGLPPSALSLRAGSTLVSTDLRARGPVEATGMLVDLAPLLPTAAVGAAVVADVFTLGFSCDQDVELTPADLALLYDPWRTGAD